MEMTAKLIYEGQTEDGEHLVRFDGGDDIYAVPQYVFEKFTTGQTTAAPKQNK